MKLWVIFQKHAKMIQNPHSTTPSGATITLSQHGASTPRYIIVHRICNSSFHPSFFLLFTHCLILPFDQVMCVNCVMFMILSTPSVVVAKQSEIMLVMLVTVYVIGLCLPERNRNKYF